MKKLTVDYTPHVVRRVTIEVPDDVDEKHLNPYDWYEEISDAVERVEGYELESVSYYDVDFVSLD